ncbi:hypothetical protein BGZ72_002966 [Mortierella alpina]|nr:hypothetical protein BGZ72_002966 [Mortierella alpina]
MHFSPLLHFLAVAALARAHVPMGRRFQPGVPHPDPVHLRPLTWGQVNIIHTTDTHGWLSGHIKEESYSADFGDFASFLYHMRQQASIRRQDLLVVDSGDLHHGTGLTDATELDGELLNPIYEKINYDALTIGNHELVQNNVIEDTFKNFAPKWGKRYLTSNTFIKDGITNERIPVGNLYNKFRLKYGSKCYGTRVDRLSIRALFDALLLTIMTSVPVLSSSALPARVMSYGFMFNFNKTASKATIEPASVTVTLPWFQKTLKEDVDMYLIVGHVPIRWPEAMAVVQAIRAKHPSKPIIFMGGHAHVRDFIQYDARAVGMASGRFLETIGWLSVDGIHDRACRAAGTSCAGRNLTVTRRYLDNNVHTFKTHSLAHPAQKFDTWKGRQITREITALRHSLNLTNTIGCSPRHYYLSQYPATDPRSVLHLATTEVLPSAVLLRSRPHPGIVFIHSLSHRFDIFKGPFTLDDTFVVSPYDYRFVVATVPFKIAKHVLPKLNGVIAQAAKAQNPPPRTDVIYTPGYVTKDDYGYGGDDWPHTPIPHVKAPRYVSTALPKDLDDHDLVDVIWLDFFSDVMEPLLKSLDPATEYKSALYPADVDINTMYRVFAESQWSCGSCEATEA